MDTDDAKGLRSMIVRNAGLPQDGLLYLLVGEGRSIHVATPAFTDENRVGVRGLTWCNLWLPHAQVRLANLDEDAALPICRGCLRTQYAYEAKERARAEAAAAS